MAHPPRKSNSVSLAPLAPLTLLALLTLPASQGCSSFDPEAERRNSIKEIQAQLQTRTDALLGDGKAEPGKIPTLELEQCIRAALQNNLDLELSRLEKVIAEKQLDGATLDLLPELRAQLQSGYRDSYAYSRSHYLYGGGGIRDSHARASDKNNLTFTAELVLSPLDFGLALYTKTQSQLATQARELTRQRLAQKVGSNVRMLYHRLQAAQTAAPLLAEAVAEADERRQRVEALRQQGRATLVQLGETEEEVARQRVLRNYNLNALQAVRAELSSAMGIFPNAVFAVAAASEAPVPVLPEIEKFMTAALNNRPELRVADLTAEEARIETSKAWLKLFPNVQLFASYNYDNNNFLLNDDYTRIAGRLTLDLFETIFGGSRIDVAEAAHESVKQERRIASMGVLVQVRMAHMGLAHALLKEGEARASLARAKSREAEYKVQVERGVQEGQIYRLAKCLSLDAEAEWVEARAAVMAACVELYDAAGLPFPESLR